MCTGHAHDNNLYSSIDAEVYGEIASYLGLYWDVHHCVETNMSETLVWLGEQGREC